MRDRSRSGSRSRSRAGSSGTTGKQTRAASKRTRATTPPARTRRRGPTPPGTDDGALSQPVMKPRPFVIRRSPIAGRGAFATRDLPKGVRIAEYTGRRITPDEADELYPYPEDGRPHHTFLFNLDEYTVVDATVGGDPCKYINHSCDPNCEAVIEEDRIFIETLRPIKAGEELVYDYQFILDEPHTAAAKRLYPCYCGSPKCRGTILAKKRR